MSPQRVAMTAMAKSLRKSTQKQERFILTPGFGGSSQQSVASIAVGANETDYYSGTHVAERSYSCPSSWGERVRRRLAF